MSTQQQVAINSTWRALLVPGVFTLLVLVILVSLGFWQLQRLAWKEALIARIDARINAVPVPLVPKSEWALLQFPEEEYRPVQLAGVYLFDQQVFVQGNATLPGDRVRMGLFVLTPLLQDDGSIVIINRGFIPQELQRDAVAFMQWQIQDQKPGHVVVSGLLRAPQEHGWFVPEDQPDKGKWFTKDPLKIAKAQGLSTVAPFIIDAFADKGEQQWPLGGLTVITFPNKHLDYAFTWFGLAVTLVVIFSLYARKRLRVLTDPAVDSSFPA